MSNLAIVQLPLASLRPYAHNPRKNDAAVTRMVEVLQEFGFLVPILAKSDGEMAEVCDVRRFGNAASWFSLS